MIKYELMQCMKTRKFKPECYISLQDPIKLTACVTTCLLEATDDVPSPQNSIS